MHRMFLNVLFGLSALCLCGQRDDRTLRPQQALAPAGQEARVALVIGNGTYPSAPLKNPPSDARAMAQALYDMQGNVWQWCQDRKGVYEPGPVTDPQGPATGSNRVCLGGSVNFPPAFVRSAFRQDYRLASDINDLGFRVLAVARTQ